MILHLCKDNQQVQLEALTLFESSKNYTCYNYAAAEVTDGATGEVHKFMSAVPDNLVNLQGLEVSAVDVMFDPSERDEVVFCLRAMERVR